MKIVDLNNRTDINNFGPVGVALGNFDGVHRGHVKLINEMIEGSKKRNLKSSVLLFRKHTKTLLNKDKEIQIISSNKEKFKILEKLGIDIVFLIDFNEKLMRLSGEEFIKKILIEKMNVKFITVGFDYRFGHRAQNTSKDLYNIGQQHGIESNILDAIYVDDELISSTMIRRLLKDGNIEKASGYLGRNYKISGKVIHGQNRGHKLGFPTANLKITDSFVIPRVGVYHTIAYIDDIGYKSLTNIGYNPTFDDGKLTIETYILDFDKSIYEKIIDVEFLEYLRDDIKFNSAEDLIKQMRIDVKNIETK